MSGAKSIPATSGYADDGIDLVDSFANVDMGDNSPQILSCNGIGKPGATPAKLGASPTQKSASVSKLMSTPAKDEKDTVDDIIDRLQAARGVSTFHNVLITIYNNLAAIR